MANEWIGPAIGAVLGLGADDRQRKAQRGLIKDQKEANMELAKYGQELGLDTWNKTNLGAQVRHAKEAGLSIAGLFENGGGSSGQLGSASAGGVTGGQASSATDRMRVANELGLMAAQADNLRADTKLKEANAGAAGEQAAATNWGTELSKKLNTDDFIRDVQDQQQWAAEKIDNENTKWKAEWEAFQQGAFEGKEWDDPSTPMAKAVKAGFKQTEQTLENSKKTGDVIAAEKTIKEFEAKLTRQGIAAGSPWYVKIVGDLLGKVGISLTGDTAGVIKK